jgi:large repetitive protein
MVSIARSWLRHGGWFTALSLALVALVLARSAAARPIGAADDVTPPSVTYTIDGTSGTNGWYRGSPGGNYVVVHWTVSDPESTIISTSGCEPAIKIAGPNTGTTRTCTATSDGGSTSVTTKTIKIDADPPAAVSASPSRPADANGWYNHSLTIGWSGSDATSGIASCTSVGYSGPDSASVTRSGSCTDNAGNSSATVSFGFKYDATGPGVGVAADRSADVNGWYNHPLTITWSGSDSTSGMASCSSLVYSGPDTGSAAPTGSCTDKAGNSSGALAFSFKYDDTAPAVTPAAERSPDVNGWYNHALTISWGGTDPASGVASCSAPVAYSGPDSGSASVGGSCTDKAGNSAGAALSFKYDDTAPSVTVAAGRGPDANGWYNHAVTISWSATDATAGVGSCSAPASYSGPDSASAGVSGSCTDKAGNSAGAAFALKYDATAAAVSGTSPSRAPDANGWYNHPLTIAWSGSDATSGIASCTSLEYSGPDSASASPSGTCTDKAGNGSATVAFGLKYDGTAPAVTATADRAPDANGWYNHAFTITWSGSDATSGIASCSAPVTYSGPDSASAVPSGGCTDKAGNTAGAPYPFKYDGSAPAVTPAPSREPDANGWYNHPFRIAWTGADAVSGIASCSSLDYSGPDTAAAAPAGSCTDKAGNSAAAAFPLKYDSTAPLVAGVSPSRSPDHDGWYNHALTIGWSGGDATAGIASCTTLDYSGPDDAHARVEGTCVDRAGNVGGAVAFAFRYDGTAPRLWAVKLRPANRLVVLTWRVSGANAVEISRTPGKVVYRGQGRRFSDRSVENGVRYRYTVTAADAAGNSTARGVAGIPRPALWAPARGEHVHAGASVLFAWLPADRATYYNLQLWQAGRIVAASWPASPPYRLHSPWRFRGRVHHLAPGRYTWYVWPGFGKRKAAHYGRLLGKSTFVVER